MGPRRRNAILKDKQNIGYKYRIEGAAHNLQSDTIIFKGRITPNSLVSFLFEINKRKGYFLKRNRKSYLREAKILLDIYNPDLIISSLIECSKYSPCSFGFTFLRKILYKKEAENYGKNISGNR